MEFVQRELPEENVNVSQVKPLKEFSALLVALLLVFITTLFIVGYGSGLLFSLLPQRYEHYLAKPFNALSIADSTLNDSIAQKLFSKVVAGAPGIAIPLTLTIVDDSTVNAYALPGGSIVLYTGLLSKIKSENELSFVLAHEVGHFAHRDHIRSMGSALTITIFNAVVLGGSDLSQLASTIATFETRHYSQRQELSADLYALHRVHAIYGHIHGSSDLFSRFEDSDNHFLLSTHPSTIVRLEKIEEYLQEHQLEVGKIIPYEMP